MPIIHLPHPLESHTGGEQDVRVKGRTVEGAMRALVAQYPTLKESLFDSLTDELHGYINLYLNDEDIRFQGGMDASVSEDDRILIIPIVAGG